MTYVVLQLDNVNDIVTREVVRKMARMVTPRSGMVTRYPLMIAVNPKQQVADDVSFAEQDSVVSMGTIGISIFTQAELWDMGYQKA